MFSTDGAHRWLLTLGLIASLRLPLAGQAIPPTPTPAPVSSCIGDCDNSDDITVNELVTLVNIALAKAPPSACSGGIPEEEVVDIGLVIQAVNNALNGCPPPKPVPTLTATPTADLPVIAFFGVTRADDTLVLPSSTRADGVPIFERESYGFSLVVEGRPGSSGSSIGTSTFNWSSTDPTVLPCLLIEASQSLGNGSLVVCDDSAPDLGGVPAVNPADFSTTQPVADAINDFACRFKNGRGVPTGRGAKEACTAFSDGVFHFLFPPDPTVKFPSTVQFCGQIDALLAFPTGDTLITARIRDLAGNVSRPARLIIRVAP